MTLSSPVVVVITDPACPLDHLVAVARAAGSALPPGLVALQLRDKAATPEALLVAARALREATLAVGAELVVNGAPGHALEVARAVGAGVHVTGADVALGSVARARGALGPEALVTAAAHDDDDVRRALDDGASAVLVSPVFASPGKGPPRGVGALRSARALSDAPGTSPRARVIALGGVSAQTAGACAAAGADGVAAIRAFFDPPLHEVAAVARALAAPFVARARADSVG